MRAWIYNRALMGLTPGWYQRVLTDLPPLSTLVDIGVGTAEALVRNKALIRERQLTIHGLDIDPDYLNQAKKAIKREGLEDRVTVEQQSVYDHQGGPYTAAYFSASFMLLPDPVKALQQVMGLLKPGGKVYFTQTFADAPSPMMEKIKPLLHRITTIHFGRVTYEQDFLDTLNRAGAVVERLETMGHQGNNSYRLAVAHAPDHLTHARS